MYRTNKFLLIVYIILIVVAGAYAQEELVLDQFDVGVTPEESKILDAPELLNLDPEENKNVRPNGESQLITGFGVQNMRWNYNATIPSSGSGGTEEVINETSSYTSVFLNLKYVHYAPLGFLAKLVFTVPLSIEEVINPSTTGNSATVVSNTTYVLKNLDTEKNIGLGFELLFGPNYKISEKNIGVNLGAGLAWKSYFEEIGISDRQVSAIGLGFDADAQWHIKPYFGLSVGLKGEYYPFALIERNNKIQSYTLKTEYLSTIGVYLGTSWYF